MTDKPAFGYDPGRHRLTLDGFHVPSVTQILGEGLPKPALKFWAAKSVAEWAYDQRDAWKDLPREAAVDLLKREPLRFTKKRANVGTAVHAAIASHITDAEPPELNDEEFGYYDAALAYLEEQDVNVIRSEATVYSRRYHYGGTFDLLQSRPTIDVSPYASPRDLVHGSPEIADFKTSKAVYPDVALQLVAYGRADFIGDRVTGEEIPMPEIAAGVIVRLDASGAYEAIPVTLGEDVWASFLAVRGVHDWARDVAPSVLQPALRRAA
jgi:hypothetical protein